MPPASKMLNTLGYHVSETAKDAVNYYQTGTFGYSGLFTNDMEKLFAQKKREMTLI